TSSSMKTSHDWSAGMRDPPRSDPSRIGPRDPDALGYETRALRVSSLRAERTETRRPWVVRRFDSPELELIANAEISLILRTVSRPTAMVGPMPMPRPCKMRQSQGDRRILRSSETLRSETILAAH